VIPGSKGHIFHVYMKNMVTIQQIVFREVFSAING